MQTQACELCGSLFLEEIVCTNMLSCSSCTAQYPKDPPMSGVVTNQVPNSPSGRGNFLSRRQARLAKRLYENRAVLDIGCGNGAFLYAFRKICDNKESLLGVELDERSAKAAEGATLSVVRHVPEIVNNTLVTMWHVAEHLTIQSQREVLTRLNTGDNFLLISIPNGNSLSWRRYGENFSFFDCESHMMQHTPQSFQRLLEECNWKVQTEYRTPMYGIFNAIQTGLNLSRPHNELYQALKRQDRSISLSILISNFLAGLRASHSILLMLLFELHPRKCSSYTIYATPVESR